jgi:hypothetical protein
MVRRPSGSANGTQVGCRAPKTKGRPSGPEPDGLDQDVFFFVGGGVFVIFFFVIFFRPSLPILILLIFLGFSPQPPLSVPLIPSRREGPRQRGGEVLSQQTELAVLHGKKAAAQNPKQRHQAEQAKKAAEA